MKERSFTTRILELSGIGMFIAAWYGIARLIVFCYALRAYSFCKNFPSPASNNDCQDSAHGAPTYLAFQGDTVHDWLGGLLVGGVFLIGSLLLCYLVFRLSTNGRGGRPLYMLIHVAEVQQEKGWFGRHKRKHSFIVLRD